MNAFEPKIIAFLCNWCSYVAADAAGVSRFAQQTHVRVVRVFCTGMVDPGYVIKAFSCGADGVLVAGCFPGDCHYISGNIKAMRRFVLLKQMLRQWGIEEERVQLVWASASEGNVLAEAVDRMTEQLRELGPLRWSESVLSENGHLETAPQMAIPLAEEA